jgi:hypothetical protein
MTATTLAQRVGDAFARLGGWLYRRANERSTYTGIGLIALVFDHGKFATQINQIGDAMPLILGAGGVALTAASTSPKPAASNPPAPTVDEIVTALAAELPALLKPIEAVILPPHPASSPDPAAQI